MLNYDGQVFFEIAVRDDIQGDLREKLKAAAYLKIQLVDVNNMRKDWRFPNEAANSPPPPPPTPIEKVPAKMPEFIKAECLRNLIPTATDVQMAEPAVLEAPSLDYYCVPDKTIICYHKFRLLKDGSPITVSAVHEGVPAVTDLLVVLTYHTSQ